jgi:hypothetical protein
MPKIGGAVGVKVGAPGEVLEDEVEVRPHADHELGRQREQRLGDRHREQAAEHTMRARQPQDEQACPCTADVEPYPGQIHGNPASPGRRPNAAHIGLSDKELQPRAEGDAGRRADCPRGCQVSQFMQQDERPSDGDIGGEHQAGLPAPDKHAVAGHQRRMKRQHDHGGHGENRHHDRRERMQQPPHVRRTQPGQAGPCTGLILSD